LRELEVIEIFARWGVFPMLSEFSLFAASLQDVSTFFHFPICSGLFFMSEDKVCVYVPFV
jgi:hypothetical protein